MWSRIGSEVMFLLPHLSTTHLFHRDLSPLIEDCPQHTLIAGGCGE